MSETKQVTIILVRHAESTANYYIREINKAEKICVPQFRNAGLSPKGFEAVIQSRHNLNVIPVDYILCSPLKRALQTCLLTYNTDSDFNNHIHVCPLIMEHHNYIENKGIEVSEIQSDPDIMCYKNFSKLEWDRYFWFGLTEPKIKWWKYNFRNNIEQRIQLFKDMLKDPMFTDKIIMVYTHWGFINKLLGICPENYESIVITFDQDSGDISQKN